MHELAHQWFGSRRDPRDYRDDRWISESVAEYLSALVYASGARDAEGKAEISRVMGSSSTRLDGLVHLRAFFLLVPRAGGVDERAEVLRDRLADPAIVL